MLINPCTKHPILEPFMPCPYQPCKYSPEILCDPFPCDWPCYDIF